MLTCNLSETGSRFRILMDRWRWRENVQRRPQSGRFNTWLWWTRMNKNEQEHSMISWYFEYFRYKFDSSVCKLKDLNGNRFNCVNLQRPAFSVGGLYPHTETNVISVRFEIPAGTIETWWHGGMLRRMRDMFALSASSTALAAATLQSRDSGFLSLIHCGSRPSLSVSKDKKCTWTTQDFGEQT